MKRFALLILAMLALAAPSAPAQVAAGSASQRVNPGYDAPLHPFIPRPVAVRQAYRHRHIRRHHHISTRRAAVSQSVTVWVNTRTGIYHMPGERWYGNTQEGEYMSQSAADKAGYRETENGQ